MCMCIPTDKENSDKPLFLGHFISLSLPSVLSCSSYAGDVRIFRKALRGSRSALDPGLFIHDGKHATA